ncbi:hypothetical protein JW851_03085 [Candidatus Woesearchaeota archaeon]|nr:hypothetical protein [Candidatus Woesearchaeota archaeon]
MKEFIEELKNIHQRFSRFEFAIIIIFILLVLLIPNNPGIIGFSDVNVHKQSVNLAVDRSRSFVLVTQTPVTITSLSVSGEVLGSGSASVYLIGKDGKKNKVFSNEQKGMNLVTGFYGEESELANTVEIKEPILDIKEGIIINDVESVENAIPGGFVSACSDTCSLNEDSDSFELVTFVEPGTTLVINQIDYTTVKK